MREYKFRGICIEDCEWKGKFVYGFGVHVFTGDEVEAQLYSTEGIFDVDPDTVGQYTGLADCKAYEGDIVEVSRYENDERYITVIEDIRNIPATMFGSAVNWRKVIGNVHEHPHLLEQGEKTD
ncbi:YopX family protein [Cohnella sp. GCM10020058]|uniref:YopX family protein n=1 Tax=Cohnella sp. GCM10020058 TaxID=3317330 RepID=UPI003636D1EE